MKGFLVTGKRTVTRWFTDRGLTQKQLSVLFVVVLVLALIPLFAIAFFNYPADDDFAFIYPLVSAWHTTHSAGSVLTAIAEKVQQKYLTWNGYFSHFIYLQVSPLLFGVNYYFLCNWFVLVSLLLCVGYGVKSIVIHQLKASKAAFIIVYAAVVLLCLEYMPAISEGVYWHSGASYVFAGCMVLPAFGMLVRGRQPQTRLQIVYRGILLVLCGVYIGGGVLPVALGAFLLFFVALVWMLVRKSPNRLHGILLLASLTAALVISIAAPGNALRQTEFGEANGIFYTLITAILDSCDLVGEWFSLQLIAVLLIILPVLWKPMKESTCRFRHPVLVAVLLFGVFSSMLVPGIYTNFGYTANRYINPVYLAFLFFAFGTVLYAQGAFIRLLERRQASEAAQSLLTATKTLGQRFSCLYLVLCLVLLTFGSFGNTIMNTSSLSAAKSLVTGEAAAFREAMAEREEYIRVTDSDETAVTSLKVTKPYVFKDDKLPFQGIYGAVRYMKWCFQLFYEAGQ